MVNLLKSTVFIGIIIATLLTSATRAVIADHRDLTKEEKESGMYDEYDHLMSHGNRVPINPDFEPDYICLFDTFQLKCVPGSQVEEILRIVYLDMGHVQKDTIQQMETKLGSVMPIQIIVNTLP